MGGLFLLFQSRYMHEHLKVKQDCGNMTDPKENESSIIHGNRNEESFALGSFN